MELYVGTELHYIVAASHVIYCTNDMLVISTYCSQITSPRPSSYTHWYLLHSNTSDTLRLGTGHYLET
jgi:hypothetical protein